MATKKSAVSPRRTRDQNGEGGELHQVADDVVLTTQQGVPVADDQNSLAWR